MSEKTSELINFYPLGEVDHPTARKYLESYYISPFNRQLEIYLSRQDNADDIAEMVNSLEGETSSSSPEIIVAIPVAGHQEAANIDRTLGLFAKQDFPKDRWEIILFVNSPQLDRRGRPLSNNASLDEIRKARDKYGLSNLKLIDHQYPEPATIGKIRKDLVDSIVYDLHGRGAARDPLIISTDIDAVSMPSNYLTNYKLKELRYGASLLFGPVRLSGAVEAPTASKIIKYDWTMMVAKTEKLNRDLLTEANTAIKLGKYCMMGGLNPESNMAEMLELYRRYDSWKQAGLPFLGNCVPNRLSTLTSSPRRQIGVIALGGNLRGTWNLASTPFTPYDRCRSESPYILAEDVASQRLERYVRATDCEFIDRAPEYIQHRMFRFAKQAKRILGLNMVPTYPLPEPDPSYAL